MDALHTVSSTRGYSLEANRRLFGLAAGLRSSCTGATHADATMGIKSIVVAKPTDGTAANAVHGLFTRGPLRPVLPAEQGCLKAVRDARREGTSAALKARHTPAPQWAQAMKAGRAWFSTMSAHRQVRGGSMHWELVDQPGAQQHELDAHGDSGSPLQGLAIGARCARVASWPGG